MWYECGASQLISIRQLMGTFVTVIPDKLGKIGLIENFICFSLCLESNMVLILLSPELPTLANIKEGIKSLN